MYTVFSHSAFYVAKANLRRSGGKPGFPFRMLEHLRAVLRPGGSGAELAKYSTMRRLIGSLSWLPFLDTTTEGQAYACGSFIIRSLSPLNNTESKFEHIIWM